CKRRTRGRPPALSSNSVMLSVIWRSASLSLSIAATAAGPWEAERAYRDDAALNLVGAAADRQAPRLQEERAEVRRVVIADARGADRGMRAADRLQHFEHELCDLGAVNLQTRAVLELGLARGLRFERLEEGGFERMDFDLGLRDLIL